jgi:hypothetical protein
MMRLRTSLIIAIAVLMLFPVAVRAQSAPTRDFLNTPVNAARFFLDLTNTTTETAPASSLPLPNNEAVSGLGIATILYSYPLGGRHAGVSLTGGRGRVNVNGPGGFAQASGFTDPAIAVHFKIYGATALRSEQFSTAIQQTSMGFHLTINAPLGSYDPASPVNVGANRWAFTPLVNLSITPDKGVSWIDLYAGGRFFTNNNAFQGNKQLSQDPLSTLTLHYSRNIGKVTYASIGVYYDSGGETFVNHIPQHDAANGFRPGVAVSTLVGTIRFALRYDRTGSTPNAAPTNGLLSLRIAGPLF